MSKNISKKSSLTFVELQPTQFGRLNGDLVHDIYSELKTPSKAIPSLIGVLKKEGWENIEEINPAYHGKNGKLSKSNFRRIYNSSVLFLSAITMNAPQSLELARWYKTKNPQGIIVAGGADPTFRTEEWLYYVDIVVRGEGERTLKELMSRLEKDSTNLEGIDGLAFKKKGYVVFNNSRKLLTSEELSELPHPHYDKKTKEKINIAVIETARGCPHNCEFCNVTRFYGNKYRVKKIDYVIDGLENIEDMIDISEGIFIIDDNLVGQPKRTLKLLESIKELGIKKKLSAQVTVKTAFNDELLKALKEANVNRLMIGIESIFDEALKAYSKPQSAKQIKEAIQIFREYNFWVQGLLIVGGDEDTYETTRVTEIWMNENLDDIQLTFPTPFHGTELYERMRGEDRILTEDLFLYNTQHVIIRPKNFTPYGLQKRVYEMYESFYSTKAKQSIGHKDFFGALILGRYYEHQASNGFHKRLMKNLHSKKHLEFLKSLK